MGDKIIIRKAQWNDLVYMADLLSELFKIEDDFTINKHNQLKALKLLYHCSDAMLYVAKMNNHVIGMVTMQKMISTAAGGYVGVIEDMIISADHRGKGIGKMLLKSMMNESQRLGYHRISLGADLRNENTHHFYRSFGFEMSHMGLMYSFISLQR